MEKLDYLIQYLLKESNRSIETLPTEIEEKKLVLLEFGVGFNTPGIIRFPFEQMAGKNKNWTLIRFNKDCRTLYDIDEDRFIGVEKDINEFFSN